MRPAQIRVFDGLRLTTEHLDHLQNALQSSVEDLREIVGLGVVFRGFEVVASGDHAITVQPGLAFDFARKRLVRDEPLTVEVQIEAGAAQFVCLKHDQIEDGQVENQFTLIWDSCSAVVQPTLPTAEDNLLPLAIVSRADDGSLAITSAHGRRASHARARPAGHHLRHEWKRGRAGASGNGHHLRRTRERRHATRHERRTVRDDRGWRTSKRWQRTRARCRPTSAIRERRARVVGVAGRRAAGGG
jgi:hypothetical protein